MTQTIAERSAREAAFGLLAATVSEYEANDRPAYGAPLKLALQRRSSGWFDESKLGFSRFKSFLEAARDAGVIDFEATPGGDLRVFTRLRKSTTAPVSVSRRAPFIRKDLWRAFFDWSAPTHRWYDLDERRAVMTESETELASHLGGRIRDKLVPIEPVSMETQLEWMHAFADALGDEGRPLQDALAAERPLSAFTQAVRREGLEREWRDARQRNVIAALEKWSRTHGIQLPLFETGVDRPTSATGLPPRQDEAMLRTALHGAIDRMPLNELLRLSIPLEYLLP